MMTANILDVLAKHKAQDILSLDVSQKTPLMDNIIICTATSNRHAKSLAELVVKYVKQQKMLPVGVEGLNYGEWVLVNLGEVVVHIMLAEKRDFYQIDQVWGLEGVGGEVGDLL